MKYKKVLTLLVVGLFALITSGIGLTYAYYNQQVTGVVSGQTSDFAGEISIVAGTHTNIIPTSSTADNVYFYIKNYTGADNNATAITETKMNYVLTFSKPTWGSGCTNPVSYELYRINESNGSETSVSLTNNSTNQVSGAISFSLTSPQRHYYRLALKWNMTYNSAACYAGKTFSVSMSANMYQANE